MFSLHHPCFVQICQLSLWANLSYIKQTIQLMILYDMQEGDKTILKNNKVTVGGGYPNSQRICTYIDTHIDIYRVSQEERT